MSSKFYCSKKLRGRAFNVKMEGNTVFTHLVELYINTVLYQRSIYPDAIYRKRRAYSTFTFVPIFPPLVTYLKRILEVCRDLIKDGNLNVLEVVLISNNEEIECHELKLDRVAMDFDDNSLEVEEKMKMLLMKLESKLSSLKRLPEHTTFQINIHTTFGSLKDINQNTKFQDFPWTKTGDGNVFNDRLLYNPVYLDETLGVDISVSQKLDLIVPL